MTSCGCLVVEKVEDHGGGDARGKGKARGRPGPGCGCGSCGGGGDRRFETMFPIYVMGSSRARAALDLAAGDRDPIWEAVKAEARSEVSTHARLQAD